MNLSFLEYSRLCVIASCFALLLTFSANSFFFSEDLLITFWLIQVVPIVAFLPSLFKRNLRAYQWLCFMILLYFTQGVLDIFSPDRFQGILVSIFCVLLFSSAILFVRGSQKLSQGMNHD